MATEADYIILREEVGATLATLDDIKAAALYAGAALLYPTGSDTTIYAAVRVSYLRAVWAKSAQEDVDYTQNQESERLGMRPENLAKLLAYWERKLDDALEDDAAVDGVQPPKSGTVRLRAVW